MQGTLVTLVFSVLLLLPSCSKEPAMKTSEMEEARGVENIAYQWGKVSLDATAHDTEWFKPRPTISSRFLGLIWTSIFDAWTRYDDRAIPLYLTDVERRPEEERTLENKEKAISYAAYRAMMHYYFSDSTMFREKMVELGYDPDNESLDPATPEGIGNLAAKRVIEKRREDGSNQYGTVEGAKGVAYGDYTGYKPVNPVDTLNDLGRWQPKYFSDGKGGKFAPACLSPHWAHVEPLLIESSDQFRSPPPPEIGSEQLAKEVEEVVEMQANLTDEQKALVEFMRDGPASVQQAGHWLIFAQDVSRRDSHTLDEDVKMYFLCTATAMDAFIACWDTKMYYDYARPYALVHDYYQDQLIKGWLGPDEGWKEFKGQKWRPYSPSTFLCPPFPAYVSGHSTVSGACSKVLELYTGDDYFGEKVKLVPGTLTEPNNLGDTVTLEFPTFTKTADMAGISRVLGGYHIQADNIEGLNLGRKLGEYTYQKFMKHVEGEEKLSSVQ